MLISQLDQIAPDQADKVRQIARECASAWGWPYYIALDYVLIDIGKRTAEKAGIAFVPNEISCRLYEQGRGNT